jgi:hypothetical protein
MSPSNGASTGDARPRATTPAERAAESLAVQRLLKQQAAERRLQASANGTRRATGLSQRAGHQGRRRQTP